MIAVTITSVLLGHTSAHAILNAVIFQNAHFVRNWYYELWPGYTGAASMALGVGSAVVYSILRRRADTIALADRFALWLKLVIGVLGIAVACCGFVVNHQGLAAFLFTCLEPFCWLILVPRSQDELTATPVRGALGLLSAFLVLYPFPVAGAQLYDALLPMVIILPMLVKDAVDGLPTVGKLLQLGPGSRRIPVHAFVATAVVGAFAIQTTLAVVHYISGVPLGLPGGRLIRVTQPLADEMRWGVAALSRCDSFYTFPGQLSYYFWTQAESPTLVNNNNELGLLSWQQQEHVITDLSEHPGLCVLRRKRLLHWFDRGQIDTRPPLLRYIDENFVTVDSRGPLELMRRKPVVAASLIEPQSTSALAR